MEMCHAFASSGHDVTLVSKRAAGDVEDEGDPHAFYGLPPSFKVLRLPRPAIKGGGMIYAAAVGRVILRERHSELVYSRDPLGA